MRMLSLAAFAVLALVIGGYEEDGMTLLIGVASGLAAVAALPRWKLSTFLTLLCDLFAIETVLFGLADLVALTGLLAAEPRGISTAHLSAAGDSAVHSRHFRRLAFSPGAQDDDDRRSVLRRADPDLDPALAISADYPAAGPLRPHQRLLPHPDQSIPGRARRCASTSSSGISATPFRSPTKPTGSRSGTSSWSSSCRWRRSPSSPASSSSSSPRTSCCNGADG